jgi:hypothetical protein
MQRRIVPRPKSWPGSRTTRPRGLGREVGRCRSRCSSSTPPRCGTTRRGPGIRTDICTHRSTPGFGREDRWLGLHTVGVRDPWTRSTRGRDDLVRPVVGPGAAIPGAAYRRPRFPTGMGGAPLGLVPVEMLGDLPARALNGPTYSASWVISPSAVSVYPCPAAAALAARTVGVRLPRLAPARSGCRAAGR